MYSVFYWTTEPFFRILLILEYDFRVNVYSRSSIDKMDTKALSRNHMPCRVDEFDPMSYYFCYLT